MRLFYTFDQLGSLFYVDREKTDMVHHHYIPKSPDLEELMTVHSTVVYNSYV